MPRTDEDAVKKIVKVKSGHDLDPFIEAANQLVTDCCSDFDYSSEKLKRIETWLAAHFYCIQYSRALQTQVSGVQKTIQSKVDLFLSLTHYGQMAQVLDTAGGLSNLNTDTGAGVRNVVATLTWLGKK